ncbi:hypothetical protein HAX54_003686 [Datura stramonium]|uniref:DUF4408 domain-containing protein n=1 Tax=Datura stramonium TaxID=4076 RepID=A0ABS8WSE2_DATST|nr:hypothetical protein [Datura stramonium]
MIECVYSWFTPTVLFCVLNLMIGTILVTSALRNNNKEDGEDDHNITQLPRTPSLLQRVRSVNFSFPDPFNSPLLTHFPDNTTTTPSFLQRVRSINLSFSSQKPSPFPSLDQDAHDHEDDLQCHVVTRSKSETSTMKEEEKKLETKSFGDDEAVDRKADDFINKFREQLKMQRIDSILKYQGNVDRGVSI